MDSREVDSLFAVADQDRSNLLDKVELADFVRLVRLSAIKYVNEHFKVSKSCPSSRDAARFHEICRTMTSTRISW